MTRLIVWRHGQTTWNAQSRIQGHADAPLNDVGRAQAKAAAQALATLHPDVIISSDSIRAADTAAALAAVTGLPVKHDPRLRERFFGEWQGMTGAEVAAAYPEAWDQWQHGEPPDGFGIESLDDLAKRAAEVAFDAISGTEGVVVLVTHGGTARQITGAVLGWRSEILWRLGSLSNCHWSDLRHNERRGWWLHRHNIGRLVD